MKLIRGLISLIFVVAVLSASTFYVNAIGFDAETAYESVFVIYSGNSMGSGFTIGENCIVTNAHVIEDKNNVSITTYNGTEYQSTLLSIDEKEDIAILIVEDISFPYLTVADLSAAKTGDDIYTIGSPKGMSYTLTKGSISAKERTISNHSYIQIDAPINKGNSGGPLLNDFGKVLGMNTLKISDSEGIGLSIPITKICSYLDSLNIELDANGNVSEIIDVLEKPPPTNTEEDKSKYIHKDNTKIPTITYIIFIITGLSLISNIILIILLIYQKKKNINLRYDPKERTDFEIDVWE